VLTAANGRYFHWAAHDDVYARSYLERSVEALERAPSSVALVYPRAVLIDESGNVLGDEQEVGGRVHRLAIPSAAYGLARTGLLRRAGGFPNRWTDRFELLRALADLGELWEIPETLLLRRVRPRRAGRRSTHAAIARWWSSETSQVSRRSSRSRRPSLPPGRERATLHDAVRSAVWAVAPVYVPHVRIRVDPDLKVRFERRALETILVNLISNAVRYGAPPITVSASVGERTVLTVEDEGRGVPVTFEARLFEPFARSERSRHDTAGLGLGLAIARLTAEDYGARLIHVHTARGARFQLLFPPDQRLGARDRLTRVGKRLLRNREVVLIACACL
jgi:hypothetical protein